MSPFGREIEAAVRALDATLTAIRGARRVRRVRAADRAVIAAALRAARGWCGAAAAHLDRAIAACEEES